MNNTDKEITQTSTFGEYLRPKQAANYLGISITTLWRLENNDPIFPTKVEFTSRCGIYRKTDLDRYVEAKIQSKQ
tara:strand:+ start:371 stop:595 length:225 start_codon:yes stop_codon:yes gene_type:complete